MKFMSAQQLYLRLGEILAVLDHFLETILPPALYALRTILLAHYIDFVRLFAGRFSTLR